LDSQIIQIWEGEVLEVDAGGRAMSVLLNAKRGNIAPHTGEIELEWVHPQDRDLVCPGAVFYLTLSKKIRHGSIENTQSLRFRRLPAWTKEQVAELERDAESMLSEATTKPTAE